MSALDEQARLIAKNDDHETITVSFGDLHRAGCTCGWRGRVCFTPTAAELDGSVHVLESAADRIEAMLRA